MILTWISSNVDSTYTLTPHSTTQHGQSSPHPPQPPLSRSQFSGQALSFSTGKKLRQQGEHNPEAQHQMIPAEQ